MRTKRAGTVNLFNEGGAEMSDAKILHLDDLAERLKQAKGQDKKVVLCHGCFDLMHPGHIKYLQAALQVRHIRQLINNLDTVGSTARAVPSDPNRACRIANVNNVKPYP